MTPPHRLARPPPPPFVVEPTSGHTHTLILLHGLGSNGEMFGRELLETGKTSGGLTLSELFPGMKFIFPTSRRRRSTAFGRSMLTMWFDIADLQDPSYRKERQIEGLAESARDILDLLGQELEEISPKNILLGGLSQGCATSLSVLLSLEYPIGAFIGMSGFLPFREDIDQVISESPVDEDDPFYSDNDMQENFDAATRASILVRDLFDLPPLDNPDGEKTAQRTPIFLGHGSADEKVPCSLGEAMAGTMEKAGYKTLWKCYQEQGHWYKVPEEIDDVAEFLQLNLA